MQSAISLANMLPYSHEARFRELEGIDEIAKLQWVGAYYREQKNFFANFAIDHDKMATVWDDYQVPAEPPVPGLSEEFCLRSVPPVSRSRER